MQETHCTKTTKKMWKNEWEDSGYHLPAQTFHEDAQF